MFNPAESKAADFRTRLDLLLGEQVILIAKESSAAGTGRGGDEYAGYLHLLTSNGNDLTELVRSALGDAAATRFDQIWSAQNDNFVNYTIGLVTHNKSKADLAMSGLIRSFVPQFSQFLAACTQVPLDPIQQLVFQHVLETRAMIDDQIAQSFPRLYADLRLVYAQASRIGDAVAPGITQKFPDKFPGNASSSAVDLRVSMNNLLQEHVYLATMTTSAATGVRTAEQSAAARALADNADALGTLFSGLFGAPVGTQFDRIWADGNTGLIGYATAPTPTAKQSALNQLKDAFVTRFSGFAQQTAGLTSAILRPSLEAQVAATVTVIDDQTSNSPAKLGTDDRSADASMATVADLIVGAAVTRLRARFAA